MASKRIIEIWVKILDGAKICNKYSKHEIYSFLSSIDFWCLAYFDQKKKEKETKLTINCLSFILSNFLVQTLPCSWKHKKTHWKVAYLSLNCRNFSTVEKWPGLTRRLKTRIAFSMFPILGTNLWLPPSLVMDMSGERSCKSSFLASENKTKYVWTLCQDLLITTLHLCIQS